MPPPLHISYGLPPVSSSAMQLKSRMGNFPSGARGLLGSGKAMVNSLIICSS